MSALRRAAAKLSPKELETAKRAGMSAERYAALKTVKTYEDWQRLERAAKKFEGR